MCRIQRFAALTTVVASLMACGGGSEEPAAPPPTLQAPIVPGATVAAGLAGRPVVGEAYSSKVAAVPFDNRNQITAYSVRNSTEGGGVPTVAADGTVSWTPTEADVNTSKLDLTVNLAQGEPSSVTVSLPVAVYAKKLVMTAQLVAGQYLYSDPEGTYTVQLASDTPTSAAPSGKVNVYAYKSVQGGLSYGTESSDPNYYGVLRDRPRANAALSGLATQWWSIDRKPANTEAGLQERNEFEEFGLTGLGAVIKDGYNLFTTRNDSGMVKRIAYLGTIGDTNYYWKIVEAETNERVVQVDASCSLLNNTCNKEGSPVILIHGFTPELLELGGGKGTWGAFPKFLTESGHDVFEFRWVPHMRFEEAAGQLTKLINRVAEKTGKKPIVVAHSFGGIVSHLALSGQGIEALNGAWQPVSLKGSQPSDVVKRLITLGSPIGGIYDGDGGLNAAMPIGRQDSDGSINTCMSITCVQAGAADVVDAMQDLRKNLAMVNYFPPLPGNTALAAPVESAPLNYAESIARIGKITTGISAVDDISHKLHGVDTVTLVGVDSSNWPGRSPSTDPIGHLGDGLISLLGQIHPNDTSSLGSFFQQAELATSTPSTLTTHISRAVPGMKYVFIPKAAHSIIQLQKDWYEFLVANVPSSGEVEYCPRASVESLGYLPPRCRSSAPMSTKHPLVQMLGDSAFLGGAAETYTRTAPMPNDWGITGTVSIGGPVTSTSSKIPYSMEVRNRNSGDQLVQTFSYATNEAGALSIDLNVVLDGALAGMSRADLYATLFFGDGVSHEVERVSVQNLNADTIMLPPVVLTPIANQAGLIDFSGKVIDGQSSEGLSGTTIRLRRGSNLAAADLMYATDTNTSRIAHTDENGNFYVNQIRPGTYSAVVQKEGYLDEVQGQLSVRANGIISLSLLKALPAGQAAVTLRWDSAAGGPLVARDLDSHLLSLDTATQALNYHIFYGDQSAPNGDSLDRDDTTYEGPETITFAPASVSNYVFYVHRYSSVGTLPGSKPLVILRIGSLSYRFDLPVEADAVSRYWRVFDIVNGQVRPCQTGCLQSEPPVGLSTQAFSGRAMLPSTLVPALTNLPPKQ